MRNLFLYLSGLLIGTGSVLLTVGIRSGQNNIVLWACLAIVASYVACFLSGFYQGWAFSHKLERTVYREK